jgi:hypothetical protein
MNISNWFRWHSNYLFHKINWLRIIGWISNVPSRCFSWWKIEISQTINGISSVLVRSGPQGRVRCLYPKNLNTKFSSSKKFIFSVFESQKWKIDYRGFTIWKNHQYKCSFLWKYARFFLYIPAATTEAKQKFPFGEYFFSNENLYSKAYQYKLCILYHLLLLSFGDDIHIFCELKCELLLL